MTTDYPFKKIYELVERGGYCDLATGDPSEPPPEAVIETIRHAVREPHGYPNPIGEPHVRQAVAAYLGQSHGKPFTEDQISVTNGTKGGISRFAAAVLRPEDTVIVPDPSYPIYNTSTEQNGATPFYLPLLPENEFLPDLSNIPEEVLDKARILWLNTPNNPTGRIYPVTYLKEAAELCREHDIILACDEAYIDLYRGERPTSVLELDSLEKIVAFRTLSKRNNMADYRVGFIAGDPDLVGRFHQHEYWNESGVPSFIQEGLVTALKDESFPAQMRERYAQKRAAVLGALADLGLPTSEPEGAFYLWQQAPPGKTGEEFCERLRDPRIRVLALPGTWIVHGPHKERFADYVRFALVAPLDEIVAAAERMKQHKDLLV